MKMPINPQLSTKLQELYLENKEWLSTILFLEDEMRFFQNLFESLHAAKDKNKRNQQVEVINTCLNQILERRKKLKAVLDSRKQKLEQLLEGKTTEIGLGLIEEEIAIAAEINSLLAADQLVKNELFARIEELKKKDEPIGLPAHFKVHRYPIF